MLSFSSLRRIAHSISLRATGSPIVLRIVGRLARTCPCAPPANRLLDDAATLVGRERRPGHGGGGRLGRLGAGGLAVGWSRLACGPCRSSASSLAGRGLGFRGGLCFSLGAALSFAAASSAFGLAAAAGGLRRSAAARRRSGPATPERAITREREHAVPDRVSLGCSTESIPSSVFTPCHRTFVEVTANRQARDHCSRPRRKGGRQPWGLSSPPGSR